MRNIPPSHQQTFCLCTSAWGTFEIASISSAQLIHNWGSKREGDSIHIVTRWAMCQSRMLPSSYPIKLQLTYVKNNNVNCFTCKVQELHVLQIRGTYKFMSRPNGESSIWFIQHNQQTTVLELSCTIQPVSYVIPCAMHWGIFMYIYIYVWKLNQTVLELDFRAVKFLFIPRWDLNPHHCYTAAPFA